MPNQDLVKYITSLRNQNVNDQLIKEKLIESGWPENEILSALVPQSTINNIPPPVPHFGMWVAFQYIILFITLYIWATCFGGILHYAVDQNIKDPIDNLSYSFGSRLGSIIMPGYLAGLIVSFPIFAALFLILKKQAKEKPGVKNLRVRKVLIYLTLIGTFLVMIGHLISTIYGFLSAATTLRSLMHLLVTLLVAGSIFIYFLMEVWGDRKNND